MFLLIEKTYFLFRNREKYNNIARLTIANSMNNHNSVPKKAKLDELGEFDKLFPELLECLNEGCSKEKELDKVLSWFKEVILMF